MRALAMACVIGFLGEPAAVAAVDDISKMTEERQEAAGRFEAKIQYPPGSLPNLGALAREPRIQPRDWEEADRRTRRLQPDDFPSLPAEVRAELERRRCTVPQPYGQDEPVNVIHGEFTTVGERDIAVLCSRGGKSSILVFRGGRADKIAGLGAREDRGYLQTIGNNQIGFSRQIVVADPAQLKKYRERYGGDWPPLDRDGIEDVFLEKASTVWFWHDERWRQLPGAD